MSCRLSLLLLAVMALGCARGVSQTEPDLSQQPDPGSALPDRDAATASGDGGGLAQSDASDGLSGDASAARDAGPTCGDSACDGDETCTSCSADCGACAPAYCGDGICQATEKCEDCAIDCGSCGGVTGTDCGTCSLLTFGRESDCIGNTLYRCHKDACLINQPCGSRVCMRVNDSATCQ